MVAATAAAVVQQHAAQCLGQRLVAAAAAVAQQRSIAQQTSQDLGWMDALVRCTAVVSGSSSAAATGSTGCSITPGLALHKDVSVSCLMEQ